MTYPSFSAAARLIGGRPTCIHTAGHVNGCMPDVFNWLPLLPQRIMLWIAALAGRCLQGLLEKFTLSHLGYQKYLLPQFRETEGVPCLFRLYFHKAGVPSRWSAWSGRCHRSPVTILTHSNLVVVG